MEKKKGEERGEEGEKRKEEEEEENWKRIMSDKPSTARKIEEEEDEQTANTWTRMVTDLPPKFGKDWSEGRSCGVMRRKSWPDRSPATTTRAQLPCDSPATELRDESGVYSWFEGAVAKQGYCHALGLTGLGNAF